MIDAHALLACPFCGARLVRRARSDIWWHGIEDSDCIGASVIVHDADSAFHWNQRATVQQPTGEGKS